MDAGSHTFELSGIQQVPHCPGWQAKDFCLGSARSGRERREAPGSGPPLDGPDGPGFEPKINVTDQQNVRGLQETAKTVVVHKKFAAFDGDPGPIECDFRFGSQIDVIVINGDNARVFSRYAAKYATKAICEAKGFAQRFKSLACIEALLNAARWSKLLARRAWIMGEDPRFKELNLRKRANTFGFSGCFLSASRDWSVSFLELKQLRMKWAIEHANSESPAALNVPQELFDDDEVTWGVVAYGWHSQLDALAVRFWWRETENARQYEIDQGRLLRDLRRQVA